MSNYTVATNFGAKDALASGNPAKLILGAQLTTEFNNIATAIATKLDSGGAGSFTTLTASSTFTSKGITDNATATALTISANGNLVVSTPSSGISLDVSAGVAGAHVMRITGSATSGASFGLRINAGTTSADFGFIVANQSASINYFQVDGAGNVNCPNGAGTLSPVYAGIPQNNLAANYTLVLADANKSINNGSASAHTFTIPANASVAFPVGTAITFTTDSTAGVVTIAITSDTLTWSPSGATGSRTLAAGGMATAYKIGATRWLISGTGLT